MQLVVLFLLVCLVPFTLSSAFPPKHLAGPPEEFYLHRVPSPDQVISEERSASEFIWFNDGSSGNVYTITVPVDGPTEFVFSFSSPFTKQLTLELIDPQGQVVDLSKFTNEGTMPIGETVIVPTTTYIIKDSVQGDYTLNIKTTLSREQLVVLADSPVPNAVLTYINNDYVEIESHMSNYVVKAGQEVGIISTIENLSPQADIDNIRVTSAIMQVKTPDGEDLELPMSDNDASLSTFGIPPHSGTYGARFIAKTAGSYIIQAKLGGSFQFSINDVPFLRSTEHILDVSAATVEVTNVANLRPMDSDHVFIDIGVSGDGDQLRAYAEVWGLDPQNMVQKAACWIGGVVQIANNFVTLELDTKWLQLAGVDGPLTLKNVYVSDLSTTYPVSIATGDIQVVSSESLVVRRANSPIQITKEMRFGVNPLLKRYEAMRNVSDDKPNLVLLPGYCSTSNPWTGHAFTTGTYFNSGGGNLGNHAFATKVLDHVNQLGLASFGTIGHSQGGMVAAHIHNYYFTGLDTAANGRLIQSVGTPWKGCTAAGILANLGQIFGIGCGSNNDLSLDGAANWLSGISLAVRQQVNFYTTTYKQGSFFGDYCHLGMNLVLQWPNDGTTEFKYATLDGANNSGNKEQWCHITGMSYKPQTEDTARNNEMNALAAR